jgi:hypothetical protein
VDQVQATRVRAQRPRLPAAPSPTISQPARTRRSSSGRSSSGNRPSRSVPSRSVSVRSGRSGVSTYRGSNGRSDTSIRFPQLAKPGGGKEPKTTALIVEWLLACILIIWAVFDGTKNYLDSMHDAMWRLLATSAFFFVLALMMRGKNTAKFAVGFGLIIDLALILNLGERGTFKALAGGFSGQGTGGTKLTAADISSEGISETRPIWTDTAVATSGQVNPDILSAVSAVAPAITSAGNQVLPSGTTPSPATTPTVPVPSPSLYARLYNDIKNFF